MNPEESTQTITGVPLEERIKQFEEKAEEKFKESFKHRGRPSKAEQEAEARFKDKLERLKIIMQQWVSGVQLVIAGDTLDIKAKGLGYISQSFVESLLLVAERFLDFKNADIVALGLTGSSTALSYLYIQSWRKKHAQTTTNTDRGPSRSRQEQADRGPASEDQTKRDTNNVGQ